jgi:hypothetical protein
MHQAIIQTFIYFVVPNVLSFNEFLPLKMDFTELRRYLFFLNELLLISTTFLPLYNIDIFLNIID